MRKLILLALITIVFSAKQTFAQSGYQTALGLNIDFGTGSTLVGPSIKHFITDRDVVAGDLLFGADATWVGGFYQYHQSFKELKELKWYVGIGPQFAFYDGGSSIYLRPMVGLDYKFITAPFSLTFDWRPMFRLNHGSDVEPARFGLGFRYTFK